jgi:hypothetical protein
MDVPVTVYVMMSLLLGGGGVLALLRFIRDWPAKRRRDRLLNDREQLKNDLLRECVAKVKVDAPMRSDQVRVAVSAFNDLRTEPDPDPGRQRLKVPNVSVRIPARRRRSAPRSVARHP